jgi:hypothetical protein
LAGHGAPARLRLERRHRLRNSISQDELLSQLNVCPSFSSARIIFNEEFIESDPTTADTHHHSRPQDTHQSELLAVTKPIFTLSDLEDAELLSTSALHHLALHFVVDDVPFGDGLLLLPVGPQSSNEFHVINQMVSVIEHVSHSIHLQTTRREFCFHDGINELLPGD